MDLETLWYELFPYLYGVGGVVALILPGGNWLLKVSGILLIGVSIAILRLRYVHRRAAFERMPTAAEVASRPTHDDD
jgi:hypothetical protein